MPTRIYIIILLIGFIFIAGCQKKLYQQEFYVFGTLVGISIWGVPEKKASEAVDGIANDFQRIHRNFHAWNPGALTDLNQAIAAGQVWKVTEPALLPVLKQATHFYHQSDGLFNPAIGQLIKLWGFHDEGLSSAHQYPPPEKIAELIALAPSMDDIEIQGDQVSSRNRAVQLDFGAFAKGYAADLAIAKLHQLGIHNAIVNAGGNLKATGKKGENPWLIGIRHPSGEGVLAAVAVRGEESVVTSGNYERFREYKGKRYSHIIDPRNGMPVEGFSSVTVIDPNGALADAASTALTVAGLSDWHRIARQMGIKYVMLVDAAGTVYVNPTMAERVQFQQGKKPKIVVSEPL